MISSVAFAGAGTNMHNNDMMMTVEDIQRQGDDTRIVAQGYIVQNAGNGVFVFQDATGKIMLDVDDDIWNNMFVTPDDMVTIYGELDRDGDMVQVEVDAIKKM